MRGYWPLALVLFIACCSCPTEPMRVVFVPRESIIGLNKYFHNGGDGRGVYVRAQNTAYLANDLKPEEIWDVMEHEHFHHCGIWGVE